MSKYAIANWYDFLLYPFLNNIRKKIAKIIIQINPQSVIDICCGTGNQLTYLKNTDIKLYGIDNSQAMLKSTNHANCFNQDAKNIQFNDNSFDLAIIQLALHEKPIEDQTKIIAEAHRILNDLGHLLILDYDISKKTTSLSKAVIYCIEFFAGKDHYHHFKQFNQNKGTEKLVKPNLFKLKKKVLIAGKSMSLKIYQKTNTNHL